MSGAGQPLCRSWGVLIPRYPMNHVYGHQLDDIADWLCKSLPKLVILGEDRAINTCFVYRVACACQTVIMVQWHQYCVHI